MLLGLGAAAGGVLGVSWDGAAVGGGATTVTAALAAGLVGLLVSASAERVVHRVERPTRAHAARGAVMARSAWDEYPR